MSVLYLFAGAKRKSDLGSYLKAICKEKGVKLKILELDILRGRRRHDLSSSKRQRSILSQIKKKQYHAVVAASVRNFFAGKVREHPGPTPTAIATLSARFPVAGL